MLELGKIQTLEIVKQTSFGVYLGEKENPQERVLLPQKEVPEGASIGDSVEVFLYRDSKDRLIAAARRPLLTLGGLAVLKVVQVTKIGAFLDWGLEKDLFLPFRQQTRPVQEGESYLVGLYIDKSGRLCATMNVYQYLQTDSPYKKDDLVSGVIYETSREFGVFVAVDYKYSALIPRKEAEDSYQIGDVIQARVTAVKPDGKLNLATREKAYLQMDRDAEHILQVIGEYDGVLPFNDKASPEIIQRETGLSKSAFKRGVGRLLKNGRIEITEHSIRAL